MSSSSKLSGYNELEFLMRLLPIGLKEITQQIRSHLDQIQPDEIATDSTFLPAYFAADLAQIPCVAIYHAGLPFRGKSIPPFGSGLPIREDYATFGEEFIRREQALSHRLD
jgi:hypothetical protein